MKKEKKKEKRKLRRTPQEFIFIFRSHNMLLDDDPQFKSESSGIL